MQGNGIPQIAPGARGIHLSWSGPASWVYAPGGFTVQRRPAGRLEARECVLLDAAAIAELRVLRERRLPFGTVTLRPSRWLLPLDLPDGTADQTPTETFRIDLDADHRMVRLSVTAKLSFAVALCEGRTVDVHGPAAGGTTHILRAARIDAALLVTLDPQSLQICVDRPGDEAADWKDVPPLVRGLTLPFRELMPGLATEADELAEARSRLLPGEDIGDEEFARLAAVVRPMLRGAGPPRPSELVTLLREAVDSEPDEVRSLDPIRVLLAHPTWRRALGFAWFDDDPALVPGDAYEYRISAEYPAEDLRDRNHGVATVPSRTLLPTDFFLDGVRFRMPRPGTVGLAPATPPGGAVVVTRRGIPLDPTREPFWLTPSLDDWSLVVDFPSPVGAVVLELAPDHELESAAGDPADAFPLGAPVPPGPRPRLAFAQPIAQLRLRGRGFLHAVRVSSVGDAPAVASVVLPPIVFADTPAPAPPLWMTATSLQAPLPAPTDLVPTGDVPLRHPLGFSVTWRPAAAFDVNAWPPDLDSAVPLDATIFEVERRAAASASWVPVLDDPNWTLGDRDDGVRSLELQPGCEVMLAFPESAGQPTGGTLDLALADALDPQDASAPTPGDMVTYRVRAIDAIGRPSTTWTESNPTRLEKHVPPPVPVQVDARVLVRDADDLTAEERTLLGADGTAVVLRWAWRDAEREQDPLATEFRVYWAPPMDVAAASVLSATTVGTGRVTSYSVQLQLDRPIPADLVAGHRLDAGHPFYVRSHSAGSLITMLVETRLRVLGAAPVPVLGPVALPLPLTPDRTRPPAWGHRAAVVPITAATEYEHVFRDPLTVTAEHPVDRAWAGVSTADDQSYVPDQLTTPDARPGNESAIVPVQATARFAGRPTLEIPAPLAPVPVARTPEPGAEPLHFPLDLSAFLPALAFARLRPERVAAGALLRACTVTADDRILARPVEPLEPGDVDVEIPIPNPDDRAELAAALRSGPSTAVEDRFVVYLAGRHAYRDRLFVAAVERSVPPGPFAETLPPSPDRWVYRVRGVDAAGHVSAGSAMARVIVRVPSLQRGAAPTRLPRQPADAPELLRVGVPRDPSLTHLVVFSAPSVGTGPVVVDEIIRVPNRPDLLPDGGLWLPAPDGELLAPTALALDGQDEVLVTVPPSPGGRTRVWLATLTADGIPSPVTGPFTLLVPVGV